MVVSRSERHQNGFHAGICEILNNFFFLFRNPIALPVFRQCIHVRFLAGDPLLGVWVAMNVDDSHKILRRKSRIPAYAVSGSGRPALPRLSGKSSPPVFSWRLCRTSTAENPAEFPGARNLILGDFLAKQKRFQFVEAQARASRNKTQAHIRSPRSGSGTAMQATFLTAGLRKDEVFDFLRADFFAATINQVFLSSLDHVVSRGMLPHQVARPVKPVRVNVRHCIRRAEVAAQGVRAAGNTVHPLHRTGLRCRRHPESALRHPG